MSYINIFIPFIIGLIALTIPGKLIPKKDETHSKKAKLLRAFGIIIVSAYVIYFVMRLFATDDNIIPVTAY